MSKVTIKEIARRAGVSNATVSRVLRRQGPMSREMEERVLQAATELGFFHSPVRAPVRHPNRTIGMLVAGVDSGEEQENSFFAEVIAGASAEADLREISLTVAPLSSGSQGEPAFLRRGKLDGLIVAGVPIADDLVISLSQRAFPTVFIGRYLEHQPLNFVTPDNQEGGRQTAETLLKLGHRRIAILSGPEEINVFRDRLRGVRETLKDYPAQYFISGAFDENSGYRLCQQLRQSPSFPTAILALSDWMALGALRALREMNQRVPQDISVIGFSDIPIAEHLNPPLTTIRIPQRRLGAAAVHLVNALLNRELMGPVGMVLPTSLVERGSTGAPRENLETGESTNG